MFPAGNCICLREGDIAACEIMERRHICTYVMAYKFVCIGDFRWSSSKVWAPEGAQVENIPNHSNLGCPPCPSVPVCAHLRWFCLPDARSTKTIMMWIWSNLFLRSIPKYHSPDSKLFNLLSWIWARHKFCFKCFKPPWRSPRVLVTCMVPEIFPGRSPVNGRSCVKVGKPDLESPNCSEHLPDLLKRS